ncbi:MAG TPA: cytochrome c-type biogenesis protein CcmH [Polyangiaceae bacterium]|jgi:cytochrome c-type biogenesis protein CcmH
MNSLRGFQRLGFGLAAATALGLPLLTAPPAFANTPAAPASSAAIDPQNDFGADIQGDVPGASALEGRLMAPCCWTQTIDIHDSEIALSMKHEIRRRLRNGESADTIQASFVQRYGPKILAVQPNSPLKGVFIGLSVVMAGAGVASVLMIGRWRKRSAPTEPPETKRSAARDQWDDKLDAELKDLDDE